MTTYDDWKTRSDLDEYPPPPPPDACEWCGGVGECGCDQEEVGVEEREGEEPR